MIQSCGCGTVVKTCWKSDTCGTDGVFPFVIIWILPLVPNEVADYIYQKLVDIILYYPWCIGQLIL